MTLGGALFEETPTKHFSALAITPTVFHAYDRYLPQLSCTFSDQQTKNYRPFRGHSN